MIDIIQWRVSIGLWNCCQCAAGPIRRGCRSIKTESRSPNAKNKTRSLVLSLITVLLFVLTLISGYLELKYNPPLRGIIIHCSWSKVHCTDTVTDSNWLQSVALESDTVYPPLHLRLLLLLSGDVELNPGPTIISDVKEPPPLPSLIDLLDELDNWKEFASRLDGITTVIIKEIEEKQDDVDSQKKALFEKWIEVCTNRSWRDVVIALKDCGENSLAEEIIDNMLRGIRGYVFPTSLIDVISTIFYIVFDAIADADNLIPQRNVDSIKNSHRISDDDKSSSLVAYLNNEFRSARNRRRYLNKVCHVLINQQYRPLTEIITTILKPFDMSVPKVSVQPDEFRSFSDSMKSQYKRQPIINTKSPFSFETFEFANLSMIKNVAANQVRLSEFMLRGKVNEILEMPGIEKINVEDIIDSSLPVKVVIDGPPGIGKTTLCRKLLNMWSNGTHKHFDLVLYCPLGNGKIAKAKDLADIFLFDSSKVSKVVKWMSDGDGKGLLIIFDGWDELSTELRQSSLATSIIRGEKLKQCSVIVTSRSYASSSLLDISNRHIQVIGFTEAEITAVIIRALIRDEQIVQELIDKKREDEKNGRFFTPIQRWAYDRDTNSEAIAVKLINYLEIRKNLRLLCCVPLICFVVIKVYKSERPIPNQDLSGKFTPFYEHIILEIIEKHLPEHKCHSLSSLPTVFVEPFKKLCQLAYNNMPNKGIPSLKLQEHVQSQLSEKDYFLMKIFTDYYNGKYQFLHLSIQEFLAAWWIAEHEEKTEEVFNGHFDDNNFRMCLRFVAGLTGLKHDSYNQYFNEQLDLQCERVPAFGLKAQYSKLHSNCQVIDVDSTMSEQLSMLLQLLYESRNTNLCELFAKSKNHSLCLNRVSLSPFDYLCLKYLFQVYHKWNHLHLGKLNDQMLSLLHGSGGTVIQCKVTEVLLFQLHHYIILPTIYLSNTRECYIVIEGGQYNPFHELSSLFGHEIRKLHLIMSHPNVLPYRENSLEKSIHMDSKMKEVNLKFNGQADIRIITSIIRGVARNETMHSFSLTVTSLDHPIPAGIIEDLLKRNKTLQALSLNIPDELLPTPLNIVEVNTPLIELELSSALMISLLQHIKGLDCLILHEQYLPHLIFHSHTPSLPIGEKAKELSEILRNCTSLKALKVMVLNMNELFANDTLCTSLEVMFKQNQILQSFELASEGSLYNHVPVSVLSSLITGINNNTSIVDLSVPIPLSNSQLVNLFKVISQKEALTQCHIDLRPDESYQSYSDDDKKQKMIALYEELKPEFVKSSHVTIKILGMEFEDLVNSNHEISSCSGLITKEDLRLALEEGPLKYCVSSAFIQGEAHAYVKSAIMSLPHNEAIEAPQVSLNSFSINCYGSTDGECWKLISSDEMDEKIIAEIQERAHKIADMRYSESNVPPKTSRQFDALGAGDNVKIASDECASEEMAMSPNFDPLKFCKKRCHGRFGDYKEWIQIINSDGVQIQFQKLLFALMPCITDVHLVNASKNLSEPSTSLQLHQMECETSHFQSLSTNTQSKKLLVISVGIHSEKVPLLTNIESSEEKLKPFNVSDYAENLFKLCETEAERVDRQSKRITKLLRKGAYEVEVPALKWHYFGVILRKEAVKSNGVLSKSSCVEYGKSLDMSVEDVDKALKSLHMSKMLLYYHDSPANDIVFVTLDSLINIVRELVDNVLKYYQTSEEIVPYQLSLLATKGYLSVATLKSCKAVQAIAEGVCDKNYSICSEKILELFQYVNITAKISEEQFFMPAILPVRNVSDPRNFPTTIPLCFYSNNFHVPMGSYCAVVIQLLSADAENRWQITSNDVNFSNFFILRKNNCNEQDLKIVLVEQLSWIEIYCEEISDVRIKVREEIEKVIHVVMDDKFEPGFKCPCGEGGDHIAKFRLKDSFAIICTLNEKEQKLSESDLDHYCSWFMDQGKIKEIKRRRRKDNHSKERNNENIEDKKCTLKNLMKIFKSFANHYEVFGIGLEVEVSDMQPLPTMSFHNLCLVFKRWIDSGKNVTWEKMIQVCDDFPDQLGKAKNALLKFLSSEAESHLS